MIKDFDYRHNLNKNLDNKKLVCMVQHTVKTDSGEYLCCIVKEGEKGYFKTDWAWGNNFELAQHITDERNQKMGYTEEEVQTIILQSMKK